MEASLIKKALEFKLHCRFELREIAIGVIKTSRSGESGWFTLEDATAVTPSGIKNKKLTKRINEIAFHFDGHAPLRRGDIVIFGINSLMVWSNNIIVFDEKGIICEYNKTPHYVDTRTIRSGDHH